MNKFDFTDKKKLISFAADISSNASSWMTILFNRYHAIKTLTLSDLVIPGSHDTATGYMSNYQTYIVDKRITRFIKPILQTVAQTQYNGVYEQLMAGIRFFDLRPYFTNDEKIIYSHGIILIEYYLIDTLKDIIRFIETHNEIIILYMSHIGGNTSIKMHEQLSNLIDEFIGKNCFMPREYPTVFSDKIDDLYNKKNIVVIYDDDMRENITLLKEYTYHASHLQSYWHSKKPDDKGNKCVVDYLSKSWEDIDNYYIGCYGEEQNKNYLKVLQLHQQADTNLLVTSFFPFFDSLETGANNMEKNICKLLTSKIKNVHLNVIQMDYYRYDRHQKYTMLTCFIVANLLKLNTSINEIDVKIKTTNKMTIYDIIVFLIIILLILKYVYKSR